MLQNYVVNERNTKSDTQWEMTGRTQKTVPCSLSRLVGCYKSSCLIAGFSINALVSFSPSPFPPFISLTCVDIVLDEVHERSVDADLLFLVVKQLFQQSFNENWKSNGTRLISLLFFNYYYFFPII
jgi:hypothetical protein